MRKLVILIIGLCLFGIGQAQEKIQASDFEILNNTEWEGTLMYRNYADNREVKIPTRMFVTVKGDKIISDVRYPNEPKANSIERKKIKKHGSYFGSEKVYSKTYHQNGDIEIVTHFKGRDNGNPSQMYKTYLFGKTSFTITTEVQHNGSKDKFIRNKTTLKRK